MGITTTAENETEDRSCVLIVEDDQFVRHTVSKNLQRAGFHPACVARGSEAIERVNRHPNIVLLLDYQLPDMTGKQVVERLLEANRRVPFIMMTAQGDERIAVDMMRLGARDYIVKDRDFANQIPQIVDRVIKQVTAERRHVEAEARLRESHRSLSSLVRNLPGMAYRCRHDSRRTMIFVSDGCTDLTGYRPSDIVGNNLISYTQLLHIDDRETVFSQIQAALAQKRSFQLTYRIRSAEGGEKWVWEKGSGLFSPEGKLKCIEGFMTDFTECKQAEDSFSQRAQEFDTPDVDLEMAAGTISALIGVRTSPSDEPRAGKTPRHKRRHHDPREDYRMLRQADLREASATI